MEFISRADIVPHLMSMKVTALTSQSYCQTVLHIGHQILPCVYPTPHTKQSSLSRAGKYQAVLKLLTHSCWPKMAFTWKMVFANHAGAKLLGHMQDQHQGKMNVRAGENIYSKTTKLSNSFF